MIGVIDYGAGNLQSVANALDRLGLRFTVCDRPSQIVDVERLILPGVGHFGAAAAALAESGMDEALRGAARERRPVLGICLGMQLLLDGSDEAPEVRGLGLLTGRCTRLRAKRVPHMGWNRVCWPGHEGYYYFAHGYVAEPAAADVIATTPIDDRELPTVIGRDRIVGVQFHPEKSGERGLRLIEELCRC